MITFAISWQTEVHGIKALPEKQVMLSILKKEFHSFKEHHEKAYSFHDYSSESSLQAWNSNCLCHFHVIVRIKFFLLFNLRSKNSLNTTSEDKFRLGTLWTVLSVMDTLKITKKRLRVIKKKDMSFFLCNWLQRVIFGMKIKTAARISYIILGGVWQSRFFVLQWHQNKTSFNRSVFDSQLGSSERFIIDFVTQWH